MHLFLRARADQICFASSELLWHFINILCANRNLSFVLQTEKKRYFTPSYLLTSPKQGSRRNTWQNLTRPQSSLIISLIIIEECAGDALAGAGGDGIIPCFISLPQLTPAPFRDRETTGDESVAKH